MQLHHVGDCADPMSPVKVFVGNLASLGKVADFFILESEKVRLEDVREVESGVSLVPPVHRRDVFNFTGVREDLENAISRFLEGVDNVDGIVVIAESCCAEVLRDTVEALRDQCPRTQIELEIMGDVVGDMSYAIELVDRVLCVEDTQ